MKVYHYSAANRYIIDQKHSIERFNDVERFKQQAGTEDFGRLIVKVICRGIDHILNTLNDSPGTYLVHSNSSNINVVFSWAYPPRDFPVGKYKNRRAANVITILPIKPDPHTKNPEDKRINVANIMNIDGNIIIPTESGYISDLIHIEVA